MAQTKVKLVDKGFNNIEKEMKKLKEAFTAIGFFDESKDQEGNFIASIAFWNEFGTRSIPERPFIRNWLSGKKGKINSFIQAQIKRVTGNELSADKALKQLGEFGQGGIKESIIDLKTPPNAPSTIIKKGSSNPLIDTGRMLNEVRHKEFYKRSDKNRFK